MVVLLVRQSRHIAKCAVQYTSEFLMQFIERKNDMYFYKRRTSDKYG
jgi:hypothetical protein